jgi:hypothetical protein
VSAGRIDWNNAPIVEVYRPVCPACGSEAYKPIRGWRDGDGSRTSRRVCGCGCGYVVISEPLPGPGKSDERCW